MAFFMRIFFMCPARGMLWNSSGDGTVQQGISIEHSFAIFFVTQRATENHGEPQRFSDIQHYSIIAFLRATLCLLCATLCNILLIIFGYTEGHRGPLRATEIFVNQHLSFLTFLRATLCLLYATLCNCFLTPLSLVLVQRTKEVNKSPA